MEMVLAGASFSEWPTTADNRGEDAIAMTWKRSPSNIALRSECGESHQIHQRRHAQKRRGHRERGKEGTTPQPRRPPSGCARRLPFPNKRLAKRGGPGHCGPLSATTSRGRLIDLSSCVAPRARSVAGGAKTPASLRNSAVIPKRCRPKFGGALRTAWGAGRPPRSLAAGRPTNGAGCGAPSEIWRRAWALSGPGASTCCCDRAAPSAATLERHCAPASAASMLRAGLCNRAMGAAPAWACALVASLVWLRNWRAPPAPSAPGTAGCGTPLLNVLRVGAQAKKRAPIQKGKQTTYART